MDQVPPPISTLPQPRLNRRPSFVRRRRHPAAAPSFLAAAPSSDWARHRGYLKNRASWMMSDYSKATTRKWMGLLVRDKQEGENT
ncbi:hypothetical protein LINPERHAP2_LOCUS3183 [Linum perenne]